LAFDQHRGTIPLGELALGIDIGTSGVRASVIDAEGVVVAGAATRFAELGGDAKSPAAWRRALEAALAKLAAEGRLAEVGALAVDGTSGTTLAIDAAGEPVGPPLMYDEPCPDPALVRRIAALAPAGSAALGATSALARAIMLQDRPGAARVAHQADWFAGLLSGRFDVSDENNALKTGYDPIARRWPAWIAEAGVDFARLPRALAPGAPFAEASAFAQRFGIPASARVCAGTTDGCASFLATGAEGIGEAVTALGSTLVIKMLTRAPIDSPAYGVYSHRLGDLWLAGGGSNAGGAAIAKLFAAEEVEALTARVDPDHPTGLDYYPLPRAGERFPINDPAFPPRLQPVPEDRARFFQGVLEGVAEIEALGYRRLKELGAPQLASVRTVGGGAGNAAWTRIRQRKIGAPFLPAASQEASVGVARLALRGLRN
jgi:sugar (pentulose or hexulose) kinase